MNGVSVIIPTYQGVHKLPNILKALNEQSYVDFEIIIAVDGSTDGTIEFLKQKAIPLRIKIVDQQNKGRAAIRNAGANAATGDLLIFYDDDMLPSADSIMSHVAFHNQNPGAILIGNSPQATLHLKNDFLRYRAHLSQRWVSEFDDVPTLLKKDTLFMTAANCSMSNVMYQTLEGFNENLNDAEDQELAIRAFKNGIPLYFDKKNIARHNEYITFRSYILRLRQYSKARQQISKMHSEYSRSTTPITKFRFFLYGLIAHPLLVKAIDHFNIFIFLPRKLRYKLYDAITFSLSEINFKIKI